MQKIMYDDKRELTRSVIEERKKRTSREEMKDAVKIVKQLACGVVYEDAQGNEVYHKFRYKVGEVVAVAQNYEQTGLFDVYRALEGTPGWTNKMFVKASIMPHQIQITDIKVQRLQDISDEDCLYCDGCYFDDKRCDGSTREITGECINIWRKDKKLVIFKEVEK